MRRYFHLDMVKSGQKTVTVDSQESYKGGVLVNLSHCEKRSNIYRVSFTYQDNYFCRLVNLLIVIESNGPAR